MVETNAGRFRLICFDKRSCMSEFDLQAAYYHFTMTAVGRQDAPPIIEKFFLHSWVKDMCREIQPANDVQLQHIVTTPFIGNDLAIANDPKPRPKSHPSGWRQLLNEKADRRRAGGQPLRHGAGAGTVPCPHTQARRRLSRCLPQAPAGRGLRA
jgi:hypothetical protein